MAPIAGIAVFAAAGERSRPHPSRPLQNDDAGVARTAMVANRLVVVLEPGVAVRLPSLNTAFDKGTLDTTLADGTRVPYNFTLQPGYENLLVWVDSAFAPASGTLVMTSSHLVMAGADVAILPPQPRDSVILRKTQLLFSTSDKTAAFQDLIDEVVRSSNRIGSAATDSMLQRVSRFLINPTRDSAQLRQLEEALAGKWFDVTSDISPPWSLRNPRVPPNDTLSRGRPRRP